MKSVSTSSKQRYGARDQRVTAVGARLVHEQTSSIIAITAIIITAEVRAE